MALSATFGADFSSFERAVDSATSKVLSFEAGSNKVKASLERWESSLSGKKLIEEATLAAEAVERIGGASFLTEQELQRLGAQADEAIEKMKLMGVDVPPEIEKISVAARTAATETGNIGTAAGKTETKLGGVAAQARAVDGSLRAVGVNAGPVVNVLDELSAASGKSALGLGKIATAGAALSAGIAGWQIGRKIAEAFGTDKIIGDFTAKLLGWGDVAGQQAAAGAETLARASANAGRKITDMAEAVKINEAAVLKARQPIKDTTVDMNKMREELLKLEAGYHGLPPPIVAVGTTVTKMADDTVKAAKLSVAAIESMAESEKRLRAEAQNTADAKKKWDDEAAERWKKNSTDITTQITGRVTPLGGRELENTALMEQMIADLTRKLAASGPVAGAGPAAAAAAQQRADDERQLEYLKTMLDVAIAMARSAEQRATGNVNVTVQANGFLDPKSKGDLAKAIGSSVTRAVVGGRG